jgi:hypothetical protein
MGGIRTFLLSASKLAAAIFIVVAVVAGLLWGIYAFNGYRERQANEPLSELKNWPPVKPKSPEMKAEFSLRTVWRDGQMFYQFAIDGYPPAIAKLRGLSGSTRPATFTLMFEDRDGFKLFDHAIQLNTMTGLIDDSGKLKGFESRGDTYVPADSYRRAAKWDLSWSEH